MRRYFLRTTSHRLWRHARSRRHRHRHRHRRGDLVQVGLYQGAQLRGFVRAFVAPPLPCAAGQLVLHPGGNFGGWDEGFGADRAAGAMVTAAVLQAEEQASGFFAAVGLLSAHVALPTVDSLTAAAGVVAGGRHAVAHVAVPGVAVSDGPAHDCTSTRLKSMTRTHGLLSQSPPVSFPRSRNWMRR